MNIDDLHQLVADKYISVQKHLEADLFIYNYTSNAQYESLWNEWTLMARGLILDAVGNVVARPFAKFFNWEEHQTADIPTETFDVYEKMDGSLGILYWLNEMPYIATRGSFNSEQAIWATAFLHEHFQSIFSQLNRSHTYLFEIIYPENRIVVDYGDKKDLVLLAVIDTATGQDQPLPLNLGFSVVKHYDGLKDYPSLKNFQTDNFEGFVLKFQSGFRVKVKLEEYVRLHKILTNLSTIDIWELLAQNKQLDAFLKDVPDEFYEWVKTIVAKLKAEYQAIEDECKVAYKPFETRKEAADYFLKQKYPMILFKMLDNRPYDYIIWKLIRPKFQKAFMQTQEE
ncbi:MAG: RNA ligase [Spirosomataceae bacterium]